MGIIRILLLADTHLGFDLPRHPRIQRRRRGPEFFANFQRALQPALEGRVDCVVHGGDLLYRSKVPTGLVAMAFEPLKRVADRGIPIYIVPGNHERSAIPHRYLAEHQRIHIFDRPRTFRFKKDAVTATLAGFPFVRHGIRQGFLNLVEQTGCDTKAADIRFLCIHQAVDGAVVGAGNYMFRHAPDVVAASDIPAGFVAVLAGHIHRFQVLTRDLQGRTLPAAVYYPGSIERTSFAEKKEQKGYLMLEFETNALRGGALRSRQFHKLPVRPMIQLSLHAAKMKPAELRAWIETRIAALPDDSIVKIKIYGSVSQQAMAVLNAAALRSLAPPSMNIEAVFVDYTVYKQPGRGNLRKSQRLLKKSDSLLQFTP
jgi:exonuclease SbcD